MNIINNFLLLNYLSLVAAFSTIFIQKKKEKTLVFKQKRVYSKVSFEQSFSGNREKEGQKIIKAFFSKTQETAKTAIA